MPGRKRAVICNVIPLLAGGKYPAKSVVGEAFTIAADIITDGHDELAASVFLKRKKDRQWIEYPLHNTGNDRWETTFRASDTGRYQYRIQAWVDHFTTWKKGVRKKSEAGQSIAVELEIGRQLLEQALSFAGKDDKKKLAAHLAQLQQLTDSDALLAALLDDTLVEVMRRCADKNLVTSFPVMPEVEVERPKAAFSTWYELFPRSAASEPGRHGTFKDVQKLLPRIAHMGFDVLYLPPIHPIGELHRKGKNNSLKAEPGEPGSPWAIGNKTGGHKSIHPELGTIKDFRNLVSAAEQHGIELAMDIAFQCAPDHPYVSQHPQWFRWRPDGTVQYAENPPKKYEDILPFHFETEDWRALWEELKSIIEYWIQQGVHIFRIDNPHTKSLAFWEWVIAEIRAAHPEIIFLAEAFTRPRIMEHLAITGFTQSYTYFTWRNTAKELEAYMLELTGTDKRYYFRPNFWPNTPDILPPHLTYGGEPAHIIRLILAATMSSNYGLYGPVYEFGIHTPYPGKEEYIDNEKYEIRHWDWEKYTRIGELISRVNRIRKEHTALQTTWNIAFAQSDNEQIICYGKADKEKGDIIVVAVNLDPFHTQSAYVRLPVEELGIVPGRPYKLYDLLSGDTYYWEEEWNYLKLDPDRMPAHIFSIAQ
jgi:starch synthase (maltosyl-transferring)